MVAGGKKRCHIWLEVGNDRILDTELYSDAHVHVGKYYQIGMLTAYTVMSQKTLVHFQLVGDEK